MTPQELAEACAQAMWQDDRASQGLGMTLDHVGPHAAGMSMTVTPAMANGHGTCHGGFLFALADSAFAFACNSANQRAVAAHCSISYLRPAHPGDRLTAVAEHRAEQGRTALYDIRIANQDGEVIAEFRGHARSLGSKFFEDQP
jgi:acyl-CoA thioesterase